MCSPSVFVTFSTTRESLPIFTDYKIFLAHGSILDTFEPSKVSEAGVNTLGGNKRMCKHFLLANNDNKHIETELNKNVGKF